MSTSDKHVVIYTAASLPQAHLLRNTLEELSIPAQVINDAVQMAIGDVPMGWSTAPRVMVHEQHAELARRIAMEFDASGRGMLDSRKEDAQKGTDEPEATPLPCCPRCGRQRLATCPACGATGNDFPPAYLPPDFDEEGQPATEPEAVNRPRALLCTTCDEPFVPAYYRRCDGCGHDFGNGVERNPPTVIDRVEPRRMVLIVALLVALIGLAAWWLSTISQR